ncbi:alpha/beta-hydrolase [Aspergillus aculeatinus CBS 121060]|uniref:Alpha/beta-hydrolase n=1 Tax=Aspergillus aculeatinus CBS 121060 TaxID=1448322 RepID=A0ACD1HQ30_9EURO|nr:alpha/beta-hydrolase [Aspergillus aculeatinus CBS 121060]RAH75508.1 alpha/beta-hydrolase [Aspergillus aculeatinus CBS 121060]
MTLTPPFVNLLWWSISDVEGYTRTKHTYIPMRDGVELCADLFLPFAASKEGKQIPVICSMGLYGKDIHASTFGLPKTPIYAEMYKHIKTLGPDAAFELCEPTIWCREYGYALLRADVRGVGGSQGKLDPSATSAWLATGLQSCVMSYESACSMYQAARRGGIHSHNFQSRWFHNIVSRVDYPKLLTLTEYPTDGAWAVLEKVRKLSDIEVPFYSAGNWTDPELHLPGNIRAFNGISSQYKWLEMHTGNHLGAFYEPDHIALQKKFLDHFLFDKKANGILDVPRIPLLQHHGTETLYREHEVSFPPADAEDVSFYLTPEKKLSLALPSGSKESFSYAGFKESLNFSLESPVPESFELLGSPYLELEVSTQAKDLDLFVYLRAVDADGNVIVLRGNHGEPMDTFARGYFRLSHRDEVAKDILKEKVLAQKSMARSEVAQGKVYSVLVPLYPAAFLFGPNQRLELEIGSVNTPSTIPPMRHEGGDRLPEGFEGENVIFSHG